MRKIQACVNMDEENLKWLRDGDKGISPFINDLVTILRKDTELLKTINDKTKEAEVTPETIVAARKLMEQEREDREVKVKAYFADNPHILYMAKTQRKFKRADLCRIKEDLYFSKYNVDVGIDVIKKVLKPLIDEFDVKKYEEERGIIKKV